MLITTVIYMNYNELKSKNKTLTFRQFIKNNLYHIYFIVIINFFMLMVGFLGELNILSNENSCEFHSNILYD